MSALIDHPVVLVAGLLMASGIGGVIGFILRGWYDDARRERPTARAPQAWTGGAEARGQAVPTSWGSRESGSGGRDIRPDGGRLDAWSRGAAASESARVQPESDRPLVLLVDDRLELLALHGAYLHRNGYAVLTAEDGDSALDLARTHRPGIIFLDHSIPGRTGVEVARELKRDPATAHIPLLMMTAHSYGAVGAAAMAAGIEKFLPKPVDPSRILREVAARIPAAS